MKKLILTIALVISAAAGALAQSGQTAEIRLGKEKSVDRGRLKVRFDRVVEDSRCPMNARCIQAGNAKVRLTVSQGRSSRRITLDSTKGTTSAEVFGYKIEFVDLQPQKGAPRPMSRRPQTVTLEIERR
jgi:hypothetical protein